MTRERALAHRKARQTRIGNTKGFYHAQHHHIVIIEEDGANAIEYGLIAALVAVTIIGALTGLGVDLTFLFGDASGALQETTHD